MLQWFTVNLNENTAAQSSAEHKLMKKKGMTTEVPCKGKSGKGWKEQRQHGEVTAHVNKRHPHDCHFRMNKKSSYYLFLHCSKAIKSGEIRRYSFTSVAYN